MLLYARRSMNEQILVRELSMSLLLLIMSGCVSQIPKSYQWEVVDCHYRRDGVAVTAKCEFEGRAELGDPGLSDLIF